MGRIAVFDSGMGGLTVLSELVGLLPDERYVYYGDSAHAPFGTKSDAELMDCCTFVCDSLLEDYDIDCFVAACNTTSTRILGELQDHYPDIPFLGIYPAVGTAAKCEIGRHVLVLATPATVSSASLTMEIARYAGYARFSKAAAPGIVPYVEEDPLSRDREAFMAYLRGLLADYLDDTDAVVLGCTHFPFVREELRECFLKDVRFYDGARTTAERVEELLGVRERTRDPESGGIIFINSDPGKTEMMQRLFEDYRGRHG